MILCILQFILICLYGCGENDIRTNISVQDENSCLVHMQIKVPGNFSEATRATGFSDTDIKTIDVLSFRQDNSTFQYRATAVAIDSGGEWFEIILNKSRDEVQVLVVLANLQDEIDDLTLIEGTTTIEDIRKGLTIHFNHQTVHNTTAPGQYGEDRPLPMWGESEPVAIVEDEMSLGTIYMLRSLAAVTVMVNLNMDDPEQKPFQLVDVVITNTPDKGLAIPDPAIVNIASDGYRTVSEPSLENLNPTYTNAYYTSTDGVSVPYGIYIGERSNTATGIAEEDRTWLLIGGIYDNSGAVTWYRLPWIDREGKQWDVLRNHNYIFNITKVTGAGNTEEDAKDNEIYADVIPWNLGTDAVFDIEGVYWIWIDPTFASYTISGGTGTINIETNYPGGWTATVSGSETDRDMPCSWLTIDPASNGSELKYIVSQNQEWVVRTGYLHIQAGGFAVTVRIDQSGLYIESKIVSPTGNIGPQGETRTVNLTGLFDDISIRVWDVTNNQEIIQTPAAVVPGNISNGNPGSVTVTIPAWPNDVNRTIHIQYYDKAQQAWTTIQEAIQEGYNFTVGSNLTNSSTIANSNQSYTINISGTAWPTIYARAVIQGTQNVVGGPITINSGATSGVITIGTYEQWDDPSLNRTVELQWSRSNTDWSGATTLNYGSQLGAFRITSLNVAVPGIKYEGNVVLRTIPQQGDVLEVTVAGTYTSGWVRLRAIEVSSSAPEVSTGTQPTITNTTTRTANLTIGPNLNYTTNLSKYSTVQNYAGHREIRCQYSRYVNSTTGGAGAWENTWINIGSDIEQLGYVILKTTGRVVAGQDMTNSSGGVKFDWTTAMGISSVYQTQDYLQSGILNTNNGTGNQGTWVVYRPTPTLTYTTTYSSSNGGCAAYTEPGTSNSFYLPTWDEAQEMHERYEELGQIAYESPYEYWINSQMRRISGSVNNPPEERAMGYDLEMGRIEYPMKDRQINRVRCIRAR